MSPTMLATAARVLYRLLESNGLNRCRPWRATRRPVVRGRCRARTDFRSGGGVGFPEPAEKICKGIRHAVQPFVGGVGLGSRFVEPRSDRRAAAAKKSLSAVLESLRQRMHPQVSRKDTRHSGIFPVLTCRRLSTLKGKPWKRLSGTVQPMSLLFPGVSSSTQRCLR